jgi:hypothetical protein
MKDRRGDQRGGEWEPIKIPRGIWPISQNQPKIHSTKSRRAAQRKIDNRTHAVMPLEEKQIFKRRAHDYRNQEETIKLIPSDSARRKNNVRTPRTEDDGKTPWPPAARGTTESGGVERRCKPMPLSPCQGRLPETRTGDEPRRTKTKNRRWLF